MTGSQSRCLCPTDALSLIGGVGGSRLTRDSGRMHILNPKMVEMGLDISCECGAIGFRAGSYSGFGTFRNFLAEHVGYELTTLTLGTGTVIDTYLIDNDTLPFYDLMYHSDR